MSIRKKILLLPVAIALLVVVMMVGGMLLVQNRTIAIIHDRELNISESWLRAALQTTLDDAGARAELIAALPEVQAAVAARDDAAIEAILAPGFEFLKQETGIDQLQVHIPPATSLIRIHNLAKRGDDLSAFRQTVVDANATGQSLIGLERGRAGLGARGVAVVRFEGEPVGTVEVGLTVGSDFLKALSERTGNQYEYYAMPDESIATFDGEARQELRLAATFDGAALLTGADLEALRAGGRIDRDTEVAGAGHAMRALAIEDYSGAVAAVIAIAAPTSIYGEIRGQLTTIATIVVAAALAIGVLSGILFGGRLARQIAHVTHMTERLANRDPDVDITGTDRPDELGAMARALKLFHEKLQENEALEAALREQEAEKRRLDDIQRRKDQAAAEARAEAQRAEAERLRATEADRAETAAREQAAAAARLQEQEEVVAELANGLAALADGDLTRRIDKELPGDYETLRLDFNRAVDQLTRAMHHIQDTSGRIDSEVAAIASAADDLSRRSEQNAATLEQTAAALDALTASVASAAESAGEARRLTDEANRNADDGAASVASVVDAMSRIASSSEGIEHITSVIDEIAFQTNLLALNAGVEAARAGEAGRGFAVVASEVRALAQRSSEAAQEISGLIRTSGNEVREGVLLVGHTGEALERILESMRQISDRVLAIANSTNDQAGGLTEINGAVTQLDGATQQNAAMFEETSAATTSLARRSSELIGAVGAFRLDPASTEADWASARETSGPAATSGTVAA